MRTKSEILKDNLPIVAIGLVILAVIVLLVIIFTNLNPLIVGSCAGVVAGFVIPSIIFRIEHKKLDDKDSDNI